MSCLKLSCNVGLLGFPLLFFAFVFVFCALCIFCVESYPLFVSCFLALLLFTVFGSAFSLCAPQCWKYVKPCQRQVHLLLQNPHRELERGPVWERAGGTATTRSEAHNDCPSRFPSASDVSVPKQDNANGHSRLWSNVCRHVWT